MSEPEQPDESARKTTPRVTSAESARRVTCLVELLVNGAMASDITQYVATQGWGIEQRQIREYTKKASDIISEQTERDRSKLLDLHWAMRSRLFAEAKADGEFRVALEVLRDLATMQNLYPPKATVADVNVSQTTKGPPMSDAEVDAAIARGRDAR